MLNKLKQLAGKPTVNFFELALAIATSLEPDDLPEIKKITIQQIITATGLKRRRCYYLRDAGRLIMAREISKQNAEKVGWTKLQIVTRHMLENDGATSDEFESYMNLALSTKVRDLRKALIGHLTPATKAVVFHLTVQEIGELNDALVAYGAKMEITAKGLRLTSKEAALMQIIAVVTALQGKGADFA
jgi:hypothetical protein